MENTQEYLKNFSEWRNERAKAILEKGNPETLDEFTYLVPSQTSNKKYRETHIDAYSCECEDFERRCKGKNLYCKHIKAILLFEKVKAKYEVEPQVEREIELIIDTPQKDLCPECQSENLIKSGIRKTQIGEKQRYECKDCKKRFVLSPIKYIKGNAKFVCLAMDCYYKGLSYRDISDQFKQFYGLDLHHETIRRWVLNFSKVMEKYSKTLQPKTSGTWNADETMTLTKKGHFDYEYVWNVLDNQTKFLLASINSGRERNIENVKNVMQEALEQNKEKPHTIITDRNPSYQEGIRNTFKNWGKRRSVKHISIVGKRNQINNNVVENLHTHQKEFHKVRRGVNEVQNYADGFKVYHNFVRKGVKDKLTPAERSGIGLTGNRWETMLLNSLKVPNVTDIQKIAKSPSN